MNITSGFTNDVIVELEPDDITWDLEDYGDVTDVTYDGSYLQGKATVTASFDEDQYLQEVKDSITVEIANVETDAYGGIEITIEVGV